MERYRPDRQTNITLYTVLYIFFPFFFVSFLATFFDCEIKLYITNRVLYLDHKLVSNKFTQCRMSHAIHRRVVAREQQADSMITKRSQHSQECKYHAGTVFVPRDLDL